MSSPPFYRYFQSSRDGNPAGIQRAELHLKKLYNRVVSKCLNMLIAKGV